MKRSEDISHKGKVVEITPDIVRVQILSQSACSSCSASELCHMAESEEKIIDVPADLRDFTVGDEVTVLMQASMGHKAVWICYVVPLFVMVACIAVALVLGASELIAGLSGIAGVAVYYLFLKIFSSRLKNSCEFRIL